MEYAQRTYNHDDEFGGLYIGMGIDSTKSNEHKEGKEERINLVETIKGLQKDVQIYKVDNVKIMKSKEHQYDFNIKLM
jgi:hypothetical protein